MNDWDTDNQSVDERLNELRNTDGDAYDRARDGAMEEAILRGDDYEAERISRTHAPIGFNPLTPTQLPGSTEEEAIELHEIFSNPQYMKELEATGGDPTRMTAVYDRYGVPAHARVTS